MAKKKLNPSQQRAVDININGVITAGAGSGKTTVLALRFLRLVKERRAGVDEILTLTFTRKAAAEMYARIHKHFTDNQDNSVIREELGRFDLAQISTLDSFCSQIVRGDCARYGIPEDFRLDKPASDRMIEETAMEFLLENKTDPSMARLLSEYGFKRVLEEIWQPLGRTAVSPAVPTDFCALAKNQFETMAKRVKKGVEALEQYAVLAGELNGATGKSFETLTAKLAECDDVQALLEAEEWPALGRRYSAIAGIRALGNVSKPPMVALKDLMAEFKPVMVQTAGCCAVLENREHIGRVAELAADYQERLLKKKRSSGLLSFQDVMELAVAILKNNHNLRRHYKKKFRFIMIDEFQDNNRLQKDLLFLLAEDEAREAEGMPEPEDLAKEKLYFVGDEKQSIYRFRGADVSVFKGLSGELESCGGEKIALDTNYRSEPGLIEFFNEIFPAIMGAGLEEYEAGFQPLESRNANLTKPPVIKLFYAEEDKSVPDPRNIPAKDLEAFHIARYIRERVEAGDLEVFREGERRPAGYDDFAVLFRSGSNQFVYEKYFRNMGIPYDVADVRSLFMEAPANDIYALLQLTVYPEDPNAYTALLRSPFVNLGDDSMIRLLLNQEGLPFEEKSFELALREEDREKLKTAAELYQGCLDRADRIPLAELIRWIWYDRGYRFTLLKNPAYHHYLEYYDYLSALALSADERGLTLAGFLDELRPNLGQNKKLDELAVLKRKSPGVSIMTVHASKGLEFPVTILADCGSVGVTGGDKRSPFYFHPDLGISLKLEDAEGNKLGNPVYAEMEKEEAERELAEMKRLLYVALTRSECHLILAGRHTSRNQSKPNNLLNLFLMGFGWQAKTDPLIIPDLQEIVEVMDPVSREESFSLMRGLRPIDADSALVQYGRAAVLDRKIPVDEFPVTGWIREERTGPQAGSDKSPVFDVPREATPPAGGQQTFDWMEPETTGVPVEGVSVRRGDSAQFEELPALKSDPVIREKELETRFGTLCHIIMEEGWGGPLIPGRKEALLADLPAAEARQLIADGETLCGHFFATPFAEELRDGFELEAEVSFLMKKDEVFLRGQIDLLARSKAQGADGRPVEIRVIDFKTDRFREPEEHFAQLDLYAEAVRGMEQAAGSDNAPEIRAFVCYLRDGSVEELQFSAPAGTIGEASRG